MFLFISIFIVSNTIRLVIFARKSQIDLLILLGASNSFIRMPLILEGIIQGMISSKKKGKNGFGYDPIFIPKGSVLTFGEMKPSKKYKIDHRFIAFKKIKKFF